MEMVGKVRDKYEKDIDMNKTGTICWTVFWGFMKNLPSQYVRKVGDLKFNE